MIATIQTQGDSVREWLAAGQSLARVLLRARADGVWASFLNQPIEVDDLRPRLREVLDTTGYPQLVLRFGYSTQDVRPTPRRPVVDVIME
jgi:hypothetical protein